MRVRGRAVSAGTAIILAVTLSACEKVATLRVAQTLKDANSSYQAQNYRDAAAKYEEVIQGDPNRTDVYFYLGNSYDNLYKPSKPGASPNPAMLDKAIANYKIAIERAQDPQMKKLSLQYLVAAYGPDKLDDPSQAEPILQQMIQVDPKDTAAYFVLARLYEDAGNLDEAEATLMKAKEVQPKQSVVYQQLAGYYQRLGEFVKVIDMIQQRAVLEPNSPEVHYSIASYYWDEAYRNTRLNDQQKRDYARKGLDSVEKAIQLKPDYVEAIVYKGLLLRIQAGMEKDAKRQQDLLKEATALQAKATEIKAKQASGL
jgi:tetratricopeptide (TPR) repeat protein